MKNEIDEILADVMELVAHKIARDNPNEHMVISDILSIARDMEEGKTDIISALGIKQKLYEIIINNEKWPSKKVTKKKIIPDKGNVCPICEWRIDLCLCESNSIWNDCLSTCEFALGEILGIKR